MSDFDRPLAGFRYAETLFNDTVQALAFRELGDASRWAEIVALNNLLPPYITDDPTLATDRILLSGSRILVPATEQFISASVDDNFVFGVDCSLIQGNINAVDGDFALAEGRENFKQAIIHAITTAQGELIFHPDYGCGVFSILGKNNGPAAAVLARQLVNTTLISDDRVQEIVRVVAEAAGDSLRVSAEIIPIDGRVIDISNVVLV